MSKSIPKLYIFTPDYIGPERRLRDGRRVVLDRRATVRFDHNGGDRRSGFARRNTDLGFRQQDSG